MKKKTTMTKDINKNNKKPNNNTTIIATRKIKTLKVKTNTKRLQKKQ